METDNKDQSTVLILSEGRIDIANSHLLREKLQALYDEGFNVITLDFGLVTGIDSSGLGKLLMFQKKLKERGGRLNVINITSEYIRKMFKMIHLYKVINIEDDSAGAIRKKT